MHASQCAITLQSAGAHGGTDWSSHPKGTRSFSPKSTWQRTSRLQAAVVECAGKHVHCGPQLKRVLDHAQLSGCPGKHHALAVSQQRECSHLDEGEPIRYLPSAACAHHGHRQSRAHLHAAGEEGVQGALIAQHGLDLCLMMQILVLDPIRRCGGEVARHGQNMLEHAAADCRSCTYLGCGVAGGGAWHSIMFPSHQTKNLTNKIAFGSTENETWRLLLVVAGCSSPCALSEICERWRP